MPFAPQEGVKVTMLTAFGPMGVVIVLCVRLRIVHVPLRIMLFLVECALVGKALPPPGSAPTSSTGGCAPLQPLPPWPAGRALQSRDRREPARGQMSGVCCPSEFQVAIRRVSAPFSTKQITGFKSRSGHIMVTPQATKGSSSLTAAKASAIRSALASGCVAPFERI